MTSDFGGSSPEGNTAPLRVLATGIYRGPHLFGDLPMIRIELDLGSLEERPTNRLPGFLPALLDILPGLREHGCSYGEPGGLVRRMEEGTWLGHVAEHVALELQTLAGTPVTRGKTRSAKGRPGVYHVLFHYREEEIGLLAGRLALQLVDSLLPPDLRGVQGLDRVYEDDEEPALGEGFERGAALAALRRVYRRVALGPTTRSLVQEAERRGIPVMRLDDMSLVQLGYGRNQQRLRASITGRTSSLAVEASCDKDLTKALLVEAGVPVPRGVLVDDAEEAVRAAERIGGPVVTKPLDGNHGRGVNIGLSTPEAVAWGYEQAAREGNGVIVEEQFVGHDYRILVVNGEVVAVAERVPAHVVGDGRSTIAELIEQVNRDPRRGEGHECVMTRIVVDDHVRALLACTGLALDSVPEPGRTVYLRSTGNLSTGGTAIDRTDEIHPANASLARRAALAIGLDVAGIDMVAPDISKSVAETGGGVVEVNAAPGFRMHLEPSVGRPRNVARPVIEMLFPRGMPSRIPILAITGTNGKSTTARMVAHILRQTGLTVGLTTTSGVYVNDERIGAWDASGPKSARMILRSPQVDAAVLETARGGILREGLAFDRCDVGAVLNIAADHLGLGGIDSIEDLARVKSVVVEAVHRDGHSVLNADDPATVGMARGAGGRIVYFSMRGGDGMPDFLRRHIEGGGLAVVREPASGGGDIVIHEDGERLFLMRASEIPATFGGLAGFNIENAMAAAAMAYVQGVAIPVIRMALATFSTSFEQSPGRLNVFDRHGFRVLIDYAHNPAGLTALGELVAKLRPQYRRVIAMVNIPGDRRDDDMLEIGAIAARYFDEIVLREDEDTRGRARGEAAALMAQGARRAGCPPERLHAVLDERESAEFCLRMAQPGDLVILTPTNIEAMWRQVQDFEPAVPDATTQAPARAAVRGAA